MTCTCCITGYDLLVAFAVVAVPTLVICLAVEIEDRHTREWHERLERESEHVERPVDGCR